MRQEERIDGEHGPEYIGNQLQKNNNTAAILATKLGLKKQGVSYYRKKSMLYGIPCTLTALKKTEASWKMMP